VPRDKVIGQARQFVDRIELHVSNIFANISIPLLAYSNNLVVQLANLIARRIVLVHTRKLEGKQQFFD